MERTDVERNDLSQSVYDKLEVVDVPGKQVSKSAAREMYRVLRDERIDDPA